MPQAILIHEDQTRQGWDWIDIEEEWQDSPVFNQFDQYFTSQTTYELVSVMLGGKPCHMLVDENGRLNGARLNSAATGLYWAAMLNLTGGSIKDAPVILGSAIVFPGRFS